MPQIGYMEELIANDTGEMIGYNLATDVREFPKLKATPNQRAGDSGPKFLLKAGARVVGAMFDAGPNGDRFVDKKGNPYFKLKLDGYPLREKIWLMAFFDTEAEKSGCFNLDYTANDAAKSEAA